MKIVREHTMKAGKRRVTIDLDTAEEIRLVRPGEYVVTPKGYTLLFCIRPHDIDTIIKAVRQDTLASLHEMIDNAQGNGYPQAVEALQKSVDMLESQWGDK